MSNSTSAARKSSKACQIILSPSESVHSDSVSDMLRVTDRYKSSDRKFKAGSDLFHSGESGGAIYSLVDGWVALYNLLEDGRRQILQFALPGTVLAFAPMRGAVMNYSAQALTDAVISIVPYENLGRLSRECPEVGMQIAGLIAQDRSLAYDHLSCVGRRSARERVAHLLLELFMRSRLRWPGHRSEEMYLPLTQEHIGDATGLTGVHVNRVLRGLRTEGILEFHYRRLHILNPDRLVDVAGVDPHAALSWINHQWAEECSSGHWRRGDAQTVAHSDDRSRSVRQAPQLSSISRRAVSS